MTGSRAMVAALLAAWLLSTQAAAVQPSAADPTRGPLATVRAFFEAFNRHDSEALGEAVATDIRWYALGPGGSSVEASNRKDLLDGMRAYFRDLPDVHSSIEEPVVDGNRVAFRERVAWDGGSREQTALAVYEVEGGRIARAWYFPPTR